MKETAGDYPAVYGWELSGIENAAAANIDTTDIPIIFRPFHEPNGGAFWWGDRHATPEQYKALWRFTVGYPRDRKGLHNIIWA